MFSSRSLLLLWSTGLAVAAVVPTVAEVKREAVQISADELAGFAPYTQFARAAYCSVDILTDWSCGEACKALSDFTPTLVGGDGSEIQQYIVGYWASQNAVVVAHEGTDPLKFESVLTDIDVLQDQLDPALFPGITDDVYVHGGFRDQHALTANTILAEVKSLFAEHSTSNLVLAGHSLGGALAALDALFFALQIPTATIKARTFGMPRVGNSAFAELIDTHVSDFIRVTNRHDLIPIVPGRGLGFAHPEGEVHIIDDGDAVACSGNDDATDADCTISTVPNIFAGNIVDHLGPYEGIYIGTIYCT
ncbi:alpha/beta-hydrolase [Cylindrobasidium torrendii FP15055 ss-10]|uniref:Alpha/beta-hydrolase n=1 Tax=Cylindrobasidium torrendii FP15055 ss-10 TaxID=1314674 RepID=A0A0D7AWC3_9AGAR|nr:alpha/beta-hydrolase [Cylindrobasidium torrendii FP15055 ss-10]